MSQENDELIDEGVPFLPPRPFRMYLHPKKFMVFVVSFELLPWSDSVIGIGTSYIQALRIVVDHRRSFVKRDAIITKISATRNRIVYQLEDEYSVFRVSYCIDENPVNERW